MNKQEDLKANKILLDRVYSTNTYMSSTTKKSNFKIQFRRKRLSVFQPINRFRKLTLLIIQLNQAVSSIKNRAIKDKNGNKQTESVSNSDGIVFDPNHYRRQKPIGLTEESVRILKTIESNKRTEDQINLVITSIIDSVPEYMEFSPNIRKAIAKVSIYQEFEAGRVIIRQNHKADNFYFIVSGITTVLQYEYSFLTNEATNKTVAYLSKGKSFGEMAIMHASPRNATVMCETDVAVLSIGRDDFIDIFMHIEGNREPEYISFLRNFDLFDEWPIENLPYNNPNICLLTFFRKGVLMCKDSSESEWIYCIKTGSCRVLKKINTNHDNLRLNELSLTSNTRRRNQNDSFIEVKKLYSKEIFGLTDIIFDTIEGSISCSLISEGSECILINKNFFIKYLSEKYRNKLKKTTHPYPTDLDLERKIKTNFDWQKYKKKNLVNVINKKKTIHENKKALRDRSIYNSRK